MNKGFLSLMLELLPLLLLLLMPDLERVLKD
jgi:hypothetical protein